MPKREHLKPANIGSSSSSANFPAMGRTERAELEAEGDYMALEVDDFEPHANEVNEHTREAEHVVDGDAPAAGDGMQVGGQNSPGAPGKHEEVPRSKMTRRDRPAAADF